MRSLRLYFQLAFTNIKTNSRIYIPYFLASIGMTGLLFIIINLGMNPDNGTNLSSMMGIGILFLSLFTFIFMFYINSFLTKKRMKEFGLYNILGMEKKQVCFLLLIENLALFLSAFVFGIGLGCLFSKVVLLAIIKATGISFKMSLFYGIQPFLATFYFFFFCFICSYFYTVFLILKTKQIHLLHYEETGEKEPKAKILICILGLLSLGFGYYEALTIENAMDAIMMFLFAAFAVMIGTYCFFSSIFIAVLKLLKKSNSFYYKKNHFLNLSNMLYRMKQNAVGLSNLCILSCMIIVSLSMTLSIYFGSYSALKKQHPYDFTITANVRSRKDMDSLNSFLEENIPITSFTASLHSNSYLMHYDGTSLSLAGDSNAARNALVSFFEETEAQETYTELKEMHLEKNHIVIVTNDPNANISTIQLFNEIFPVDEVLYKKNLETRKSQTLLSTVPIYEAFIDDVFSILDAIQLESISYTYEFSTTEKDTKLVVDTINTYFAETDYYGVASSTEESLSAIKEIYGELLVLGIFLGISFMIAAGLIMYYKQVSEGYADLERYRILQQVGLSHEEVKRTINSEIILVFFLPLLVSVLHLSVAFKMENNMLKGFNILDASVLFKFDLLTIFAFSIFYFILYKATSHVYYKIIKR